MKFDGMAATSLVAALASLAACDPHPKPAPPKAQTVASALPPPADSVLGSGTQAALGQDEATPELPGPGEHAHRGGVFGVGIRPSGGASGIRP
jgi:hypothetical protein